MRLTDFNNIKLHKTAVVIIVAATMTLGACTIERQAKGFIMDQQFVEGITPGFDNKTSIVNGLGNPSVMGTFDDDTWYYMTEISRRRSFFKPSVTRREIFAIKFDEIGRVEEIQTYTLADAIHVKPRGDKTPTRGKKLGVFEQIFSNIGRFSNAPTGPTQ